MGKFEDLIQSARDGDAEALETLEKEFGGSNLREQTDTANAALKDNEDFIRAGKFQALQKEADAGILTLEDLDGVDYREFSVDLLKEKAETKTARETAFQEEAAKRAGFDSVEEMNKALDSVKQKQTATATSMEAIGGATASTSGGDTPPSEPVEPYDAALADYKSAVKTGATQDVAIGEAAHTLMAAQHPAAEESI